MPQAKIDLVEVEVSEKEELWKELQKDLHELDENIPPGEEAAYPGWDSYWDGTPGRYKYWIVIGGGKVGFVLLRDMDKGDWPTVPPPTEVTKLSVYPGFRGRDIGFAVLVFLLRDASERGDILTWSCAKSYSGAVRLFDRAVAEFRRTAPPHWTCDRNLYDASDGPAYRYVCGVSPS